MLPNSLSGATRLVPILAHPVGHVQAPSFYNPAFAAAGLDWCQVPMGVHPDDLGATLAQLARVSNLQGLNLTIPHKPAAHALSPWLGPEARRTGVVNTMRLQPDGAWAGESYDGIGFVEAARAHGLLRTDRATAIVGTGGAGTAIAFALAAAGVDAMHLSDREPARAERLARALVSAYPDITCSSGTADGALEAAGLAVNATPLGLEPGEPMPFDPARLPVDAGVFDIIAVRDTELMAASRGRGLRVIGGGPMIDHQIAAQIAFWRGDPIDLAPHA